LSDLSTEVGAFWVFVTSFSWNDVILGTSEGVQLLLVVIDLLGEF